MDSQTRMLLLKLLQSCQRLGQTGTEIMKTGTTLSNQRANIGHQHRHLQESSDELFQTLRRTNSREDAHSKFLTFEEDTNQFLLQVQAMDTVDSQYRDHIFRRMELESRISSLVNDVASATGLRDLLIDRPASNSEYLTGSSEAEQDYHPLLRIYYEKAQDYSEAVDNLRELWADRQDERQERAFREDQGLPLDLGQENFEAGYDERILIAEAEIKGRDAEKQKASDACREHGVEIPVEENEFDMISETGSERTSEGSPMGDSDRDSKVDAHVDEEVPTAPIPSRSHGTTVEAEHSTMSLPLHSAHSSMPSSIEKSQAFISYRDQIPGMSTSPAPPLQRKIGLDDSSQPNVLEREPLNARGSYPRGPNRQFSSSA